jgi:hypothetical protein
MTVKRSSFGGRAASGRFLFLAALAVCMLIGNAVHAADPDFGDTILIYNYDAATNAQGKVEDTSNISTNDGTLPGGASDPTWYASSNGVSAYYDFDGGDHIRVPDNTTVQGQAKVTLMLWFKADNASASGNHWLYWEPTDSAGYPRLTFDLLSTGVRFFGGSGNTSYHTCDTTSTISNDVWYHVVGTYDSDSNEQVIYLNGVEEGRNSNSKGPIDSGALSQQIWVGGYSGGAEMFTGGIDGVRVYTNALSSNAVYNIWNETKGSHGYESAESGSLYEF